jgi:hypothetical protein
MVPDSSSDGPAAGERAATDDGPAPNRDNATYDLVYRATRDAIWDVLGTATLLLCYLALAAVCASIAVAGIGRSLRGSVSYPGLAGGLVALVVGCVAAVRVYRLATE